MTLINKIRVIKARHFVRFMNFYLWLYGRFRYGTKIQKFVTAMCSYVSGPVPCVLKIDLLQKCNLKCHMCYARHSTAQMSLEDFKKIVTPLRGIGARADLMGGEPWLYPYLEEAIAFLKDDVKFKEIIAYTNGTVISPEKARAVKKAGLTHAMVNLSSHDAQKHDAFTGVKGSWNKTIEGIKNLRDADVETNAFIVLHKKNIDDYKKIMKFIEDELRVNPVFYHYVPRDSRDSLMPSKEQWHEVKKDVMYGNETGRKHGKTVAKILTVCGTNCLGGYHSWSIKVNGDVAPCPFIHDIIIGNALKDDLWQVFLTRNNTDIYRDFSSVPLECQTCSYTDACAGGCRAGQDGDYLKKDPRCVGPWKERVCHEKLFEKIPTFF